MNMDIHSALRQERCQALREEAQQGRRRAKLAGKRRAHEETGNHTARDGQRSHFALRQPHLGRKSQQAFAHFDV